MNSQIQFETNGLRVLVCNVPNDANHFESDHGMLLDCYERDSEIFNYIVSFSIPQGEWQIHSICDSITEERAKVLVKFVGLPWCAYKDYTSNRNWYNSAKESLNSLLRSHGINPNEKHVILIEEV